MNKFYTFLAAILLTTSTFAQAPEKMSYQAVIRNSSDVLVANQAVGMRISILQTTATGTAVYVETQTTTTNINGLVSLEIGTGTPVTGTFTGIDWANGPYFIKTETDPTGGTSYTIAGTNELMSVPYALHAKTAESVSGTITETDPVFTAWDKDYADLINIPAAADGSETKVTAGTNVTVTGSGTTASPYVVNSTAGGSTLAIGDSYQGGIIFWLDATGQHGLIAATTDQSTGIQWYNGNNTTTNAVRDGIGAGMYNTERIIANQSTGSYAAQLCANYQGGGYGDWYLPSKYELNLLYQQRTVVGGFAIAAYWSSSENHYNYAWGQNFGNGDQDNYLKSTTPYYVRAIRAF